MNESAGNSQTVVVWGSNLLAGLMRAALPQSGLHVFDRTESVDTEPDALLLVDDVPAAPGDVERCLEEARSSYPNSRICIISECDYSHLIHKRENRVVGYVHTSVSHDALPHIVQVLVAGGEYIFRRRNGAGNALTGDSEFMMLSEREREICELVRLSFSNKVIAQRLGLSDNTIKVHLRRVMRKLGAHTRVEIALHSQASSGRIEPWPPSLQVNGHGV